MKFSVGYQMRPEPDFLAEVVNQKEHIHEVYFSWGQYPNGRSAQGMQQGLTQWEAYYRQEADIAALSAAGLNLNLLFNATCYGKDSQSKAFFDGVGNTVDYLSRYNLTSVTTTSLLIARFLQDNFPQLDVRASVNMGIGTEEGLDYVKDYFDSFYLKRELNRDFRAIRQLKSWCDDHGKTLYGLANSGCLNHCSAHTFHDNLVSHEQEISQMDNGYAFEGVCRAFLKDPANHYKIIDRTGFIRPEDVELYEGLFPALKLATRVSPNPLRILRAYTARHYRGNMLELLEPNHSGIFYPHVLENSRIISQVEDEKLLYIGLEDAIIQLEESLC